MYGQFKNKSFTINQMKCPDLYKSQVSNTHPMGGVGGLRLSTKNFMARNCMKCVDLDRKIIFLIPHPSSGSNEDSGSQLTKNLLLEKPHLPTPTMHGIGLGGKGCSYIGKNYVN